MCYNDIHDALNHTAPNQFVDEDRLLRMKLGAMLTPVMLEMTLNSSDQELDTLARSTIGVDATVFKLTNKSTEQQLKLKVDIVSPLFERTTFPFEISPSQNPITIIPEVLPGIQE
ncbi:hypothetical protein [Escherichia coli]|nr:hypothetical protein [Escherichia coli]